MLGGGLSLGLGRALDLVAGADFQSAQTSDGDVWHKGDDPQFVTASIPTVPPRSIPGPGR